MTDLSETPAVPPVDPGGSERTGLAIAGALLVLIGFGGGVLAHLLAHLLGDSTGLAVGPWTVHSTLGPYAWALLVFGFVTGLIGVAFLAMARDEPKGPAVLPGFPY